MKKVNGVVKKYSREYSRTLKDGTKKNYKTEQVQITIPKQDNIFDDKEEVIILPSNELANLEDQNEIIASLEFCNAILTEKNRDLNSQLDLANDEMSNLKYNTGEVAISKYDADGVSNAGELVISKSNVDEVVNNDLNSLKEELNIRNSKIIELQEELESLNENIEDLEDMVFKNSENIDNSKDISENSYSNLTNDFNNSNNIDSVDNINKTKLNSNFSYKDYLELQKAYIELSKKFELIQADLCDEKINSLYHKGLANKFKDFILRID